MRDGWRCVMRAFWLYVLFCVIPLTCSQAQERVDAREFFGSCKPPAVIDVNVDDPDVLVFDEKDNEYYCANGSSLLIGATNIELHGNIVIKSFCNAIKRIKSCDGKNATVDTKAAPVKRLTRPRFLKLEILHVTGDGTLTFSNTGSEAQVRLGVQQAENRDSGRESKAIAPTEANATDRTDVWGSKNFSEITCASQTLGLIGTKLRVVPNGNVVSNCATKP